MALVASEAHSLAMAAPPASSSPSRYCCTQPSTKARVAAARVLMSASLKRMCWLSIKALSKARLSLV
ncbi:hypothetical protein D3C72_2388790 [compost metagenome]